jgi:hypothetical protein
MKRFLNSAMAAVMGLVASVGLPVALDDKAARRLSGVVRCTTPTPKPAGAAPGRGGHRRQYLPNGARRSCRFVYARGNGARDARLRVISNNDRIENAVQADRLARKGLRVSGG